MHAQLYMDPAIRDYVFLPLCLLMLAFNLLRMMGFRYMHEAKNSLMEPARLSFKVLEKTMFPTDADMSKGEVQGPADIYKMLDQGEAKEKRENAALLRSGILRKNAEFLPENAVKLRKAFFCHEKDGFFSREVQTPKMDMTNPSMMNNMLMQNLYSVANMITFQVIGSIFQGFITAQIPFPLGVKFKGMTQQGVFCTALDPIYVSSLSW